MPSRKEVEDSFEAVPAYIVADKRDKFGHRLGLAAFILMLLFFVISSYIQSARNGAQLDEARKQRDIVIHSQDRITMVVQGQGQLILALQEVINRQNIVLAKAGLPVELSPNLEELIKKATSNPGSTTSSPKVNRTPSPRADPKPAPTKRPRPATSPKASPSPRPKPSPTPSPTRNPVSQLVCDITTVCLSK